MSASEPESFSLIVFRIYGGRASLLGRSWTPIDPSSMLNVRDALGLPEANTGEHVASGRIIDWEGVMCRRALPGENSSGGGIEYLIPDPERQIEIIGTRRAERPY